MPYLPNAQSFLEQSSLLISARPTTASLASYSVAFSANPCAQARLTTKYNVPHPSPPPNKHKPSSLTKKPTSESEAAEDVSKDRRRTKKALLTLKCYDPVSGTCLKYRTEKGAEVGRLVAILGRCGRAMTGLPPKAEVEETGATDLEGAEAGKLEKDGEAPETGKEHGKVVSKAQPQGPGQGKGGESGGGKKKKKGKR